MADKKISALTDGTTPASTDLIPVARSGGTTVQLAWSELLTAIKAITLDLFAAPAGNVALNAKKITGLADPTLAQDAVTKFYVDNVATGVAWKAAVNYATTAALAANTYSAGVLTEVGLGALVIDGTTQTIGNRVLVKNEVTASHNGIYTVTTVGSAGAAYVLTRATDYNTSAEITTGDGVYVDSGTANGNTAWILTSAAPITLDTTALTFTQFGAGLVSSVFGQTGAVTASQAAVDTFAAATDVTTNNVTSSAHGFAPKSPADATKFLNGAATPAFATPEYWRIPADYGVLAYNFPPHLITTTGGNDGTGIWHIQRIIVRNQITVASIAMWLTQAAATYTSNRNFAALWTQAGALVAWSAEATCETAWGTLPGGVAGQVNTALDNVVTSLTLPAGGYYVGWSALASTTPNFGRISVQTGGAANLGRAVTSGGDCYATGAVSAATPPSTVSPMPAVTANVKSFWMGLV